MWLMYWSNVDDLAELGDENTALFKTRKEAIARMEELNEKNGDEYLPWQYVVRFIPIDKK